MKNLPEELKKFRIVFGFHVQQADQQLYRFSQENVCKIKKVIAYSRDGADWALVKLKIAEKNKPSLPVHFEKVTQNTNLYMWGHPSGLPKKYAEGAEVKSVEKHTYQADLDAYSGNSGSPVFCKVSRHVIGILINGNPDYVAISNYSGTSQTRLTANRVRPGQGYEQIQRLDRVNFVKYYIQAHEKSAEAQYRLGLAYLEGEDVEVNNKKAMKWFYEAACQGNRPALHKFEELVQCHTFEMSSHSHLIGVSQSLTVAISENRITIDKKFSSVAVDFLVSLCRPSKEEFSFSALAEVDKRFELFIHLRSKNLSDAEKIFKKNELFFIQSFMWDSFQQIVIERNRKEYIDFFLKKSSVNEVFKFNKIINPLCYAYHCGAFNSFQALLSAPHLNLKYVDDEGATLLHYFARNNQLELLKAYYFELNRQYFSEETRAFLNQKAWVGNKLKTAYDIARDCGYLEIVRYLTEQEEALFRA